MESAGHLFFMCEFFSKVWNECLKWWGYKGSIAVCLCECKHFIQFAGMIQDNSVQVSLWEVVWFAVIWVIWSSRNSLIFKGKKVELGEMVEQVKLKSWLWITWKSSEFGYPVSNWFSNPRGCLGLGDSCYVF